MASKLSLRLPDGTEMDVADAKLADKWMQRALGAGCGGKPGKKSQPKKKAKAKAKVVAIERPAAACSEEGVLRVRQRRSLSPSL
eukprot:15479583-Alexandrium_andersonii.AAC.1